MTDDTIFRPAATAELVTLDEPAAPGEFGTAAEPATAVNAAVSYVAPFAPDPPDPAPLGRPRTRWAAIIWGLVLGGIAAGTLRVLLDPELREGLTDWILGLSPLAIVSYTILVLGGLLLVAGLAGLAGRAQRRLAARRASA